jgi:hypothetical protein
MRDTNRDTNISHELWMYYTSGTVHTSIIFARSVEGSNIPWSNQDANEKFEDEYWQDR